MDKETRDRIRNSNATLPENHYTAALSRAQLIELLDDADRMERDSNESWATTRADGVS